MSCEKFSGNCKSGGEIGSSPDITAMHFVTKVSTNLAFQSDQALFPVAFPSAIESACSKCKFSWFPTFETTSEMVCGSSKSLRVAAVERVKCSATKNLRVSQSCLEKPIRCAKSKINCAPYSLWSLS